MCGGISSKYIVTAMILSHSNHLLWEVNRRKQPNAKRKLPVFTHLKIHKFKKAYQRYVYFSWGFITNSVGQANLGGRLGNYIFSHKNSLRQWALRWNWTFYIPFQSYTPIRPRNFKFGGIFSSLKLKNHALAAPIEDLKGFVTWHQKRVWRWVWRS